MSGTAGGLISPVKIPLQTVFESGTVLCWRASPADDPAKLDICERYRWWMIIASEDPASFQTVFESGTVPCWRVSSADDPAVLDICMRYDIDMCYCSFVYVLKLRNTTLITPNESRSVQHDLTIQLVTDSTAGVI